jgi:Fe-S-cluster containining protein
MSHRSSVRSAFRDLLRFYDQVDDLLYTPEAQQKWACSMGCCDCCYQLPVASIMEMLIIVDEIYDKDTTLSLLNDLVHKSAEQADNIIRDPTITIESWFDRQYPCVLLDKQTNHCLFYEKRPVACRTYLVPLGHREKCKVSYKGLIPMINMDQARDAGVMHSLAGSNQLGIPMLYGPLPVIFYWAAEFYLRGRPKLLQIIKDKPWETTLGCSEFWTHRLKYAEAHETTSERSLQEVIISPEGE